MIQPIKQGINLFDAYGHFMNGEIGRGRQAIAQFYYRGFNTPRATLYEAAIEKRAILDLKTPEIDIKEPTEDKVLLRRRSTAIREIFFPSHPMTKDAVRKCENKFFEVHPDYKSELYSRFVIAKTQFPILKYLKSSVEFLARFGEFG